jgi:hypothetical protein
LSSAYGPDVMDFRQKQGPVRWSFNYDVTD